MVTFHHRHSGAIRVLHPGADEVHDCGIVGGEAECGLVAVDFRGYDSRLVAEVEVVEFLRVGGNCEQGEACEKC